MIKLKDILNEIEGEKQIHTFWKTPSGTPDEVINVIHEIYQLIMNKMGSGNDLLLANFLKANRIDEGTWAIVNPSTGMVLKYIKRGGIWELVMPGDAVGRQLNQTDLENVITHWMR